MDVRSTIVSGAKRRDIAFNDPPRFKLIASRPPSPPRRQSSRNSKTLKLYGNAKRQTVHDTQPFKSRHKQCFLNEQSTSNVVTLRERFCGDSVDAKKSRETVHPSSSSFRTALPPRSKVLTPSCKKKTEDSAGEKSFSAVNGNRSRIYGDGSSLWRPGGSERSIKSEAKHGLDKSSSILKMSSKHVSPSAARSTKEKLECKGNGAVGNTVSHSRKSNVRRRLTRKEQEESSRRLARSSVDLSSMESRKRLQTCGEKGDVRATVLPSGTLVKSSTMLYSSSSGSGRQRPPRDKSLKVVVTVSSKGQEIVRKPLDSISAAKSTSSLKSSSATSSPSVVRRTVLTDPKKPRTIVGHSPEKKMGSSREFASSSEAISESSKKKRQRPGTVVRSPARKLETIRIDPIDEKGIEAKRRSRKVEKTRKSGDDETMESDGKSNIENEEPNIRQICKSKQEQRSSPSVVEEMKKHGTSSDTFFQNLFLRSICSGENVPWRRWNVVSERARIYQENRREGSKSEPSLKSLSIYLAHKRPVSNSKFKNWEKGSISSRSSSPYGVSWPGRSVFQKVSKFDSLLGIEDFGSSTTLRDKSPDPVKERLKERSLSEPPLKTECSDSKQSSSRASSPSSIRSPACRRIRSLKQDGPSSSKKVRARSAGEAEQSKQKPKFGSDLSLARSTNSLCASPIDREEYHRHVAGVLHDRRRSERYKELYDFYSSLERLGELERTCSSTDLRPRMKNEEIIDYDRWKKVRSQERAEVELGALYGKLKAVQKEKNFLFSTKDIGKFKWHGDCNLRCKERSVENIIQHFKRLQSEGSELDSSKRREISWRKDTYKPLWRGTSVINVASTMQEKADGSKNERCLDHLDHPSLQRSLGGSKKFWSSLSIEQVATLKKQLNEIYGSDNLQRSVPSTSSETGEHRWEKKEGIDKRQDSLSKYEIIVPPEIDSTDKDDAKGLHVRCHSMITPDASPSDQKSFADRAESLKRSGSISRGKSIEGRSDSDKGVIKSVASSMSELERKRLSVTIGKEVLDKISQRRLSMPLTAPRETRGSMAAALAVKKLPKITRSSTAPSVTSTSPRSCYSLEPQSAEDSPRVKEKNDFLLVLTPNNKSPSDRRRVENVLEEWSKKPPLLAIAMPDAPNQKTKTVAPNSGNSEGNSTTESSETSVRTVIQRNIECQDVPAKIEFFENVEKSADPQSDRGKRNKEEGTKPGRLSSSQSFADLRELFGESEAGKYALSGCRTRSISPRAMSDKRKGSSPAREMDTNTRAHFCSRDREHDRPRSVSPCRVTTRSNSSCSLESIWLRSSSPDPDKYWRAYLKLVKNGTVRRLRAKFESAEDLRGGRVRVVPKKFQSDPELARCFLRKVDEDKLKPHEFADVAWLRRKYEPRRGRARRRGESPPIPRVPLRKEDLSMPHIDVISKTAELKDSSTVVSTITNSVARKAETKELEAKKPVGRMRKKFEKFATQKTSILGEMFTSSPDVHELRDIAPYLAGRWVAHRYPSRRDNMRSLSSPPDLAGRPCPGSKSEVSSGSTKTQSKEGGKLVGKVRGVSSKGPSSILKQSDGDQTFDPDKHRPKFRYQPPPPPSSPNVRRKATCWWSPIPIYTARPTVTFEGLNFHNVT